MEKTYVPKNDKKLKRRLSDLSPALPYVGIIAIDAMINNRRVQMKNIMIVTASILALGAAVPVLASSDAVKNETTRTDDSYYGSGNVQWMSLQEVRNHAAKLGIDVRRIEREHGYYEVKGFDKQGRSVELYMHPTTGKVIKSELKYLP